ncbi:hypothetical protein C8A01DRAFT_15570 [Parachaetomium inaequale]|uniref:C2H2-type domain-containing protein n=1 Tax=Parachaetomium inaequale TaxID=2588326 RepID=A0AAN6PK11_9PEZI|nr:hypothetical protein C8A01DRAFT_15570 [Parachaetomium inaequale]
MTQPQSRQLFYQQQPQHQNQHLQPAAAFYDRARHTASPFQDNNNLSALDFDLDLDLDLDLDASNLNYNSLSSSPISTQSLLSQFSPLSAFDSIPTPTLAEPSLFHPPRQSGPAVPKSSAPFFANTAAMQTEAWMPNGQLTPRSVGRFSHQRDSSRSSMGSNGPVSPFSHNLANPQIAMSDAVGDNFHGLPASDDLNHYQLAAKSFPGVTHDSFYATLPSYGSTDGSGIAGYSYLAATAPRRRNDRSLLPEHPIGPGRSQPVSVASSIASDSPATPAGEPEEDRKRTTAIPPVPKLDRTMTDAYTDELYSPNFAITSPSSGQASISPTSDLFNQRLQAANNQHLSAVTNSPVSSTSRDRSPFRHGSPLAPMPMNDFRSAMGPAQMRFGTAQRMREQNKAMQDVQAAQQQMARSADTSTPQTISPKDAMLDFHEPEGEANFPLFPQQNNTGFNADAINKAAAAQSQQVFGGLPMDTNTFNSFMNSSMPAAMQVPQQYPFMAQPRPQSAVPSMSNTSVATTRLGSADTGATESVHGVTPQRPADTRADGGTYTCTYHGCTMRFDTPALLQKHKREGHRQAHGLNGARRPEAPGMTSTLLNTQAGPHRCDRINPSTGKPCSTVFSRPYDLTRHEHTIHNARKQKVRCDLCTDDKTFSRADALTRHYRVCHPDVEFPGKQRKRAGHSG